MKTLKFKDSVVKLVLDGSKTATWRLFDDKDLQVDDDLLLQNADTKEMFAIAKILEVREKKLGDINDTDFDGHEKFSSKEDMVNSYKEYYGDKVTLDSIVKMIKFKIEYKGKDFYCDVVLKDPSSFKIEHESENVLAIHHSRPYWPVHIVVFPKKHIPSFTNREDVDNDIFMEVLEVIKKIAKKVEDESGAARIMTNLGRYQDSKHLHFHVSSGELLK